MVRQKAIELTSELTRILSFLTTTKTDRYNVNSILFFQVLNSQYSIIWQTSSWFVHFFLSGRVFLLISSRNTQLFSCSLFIRNSKKIVFRKSMTLKGIVNTESIFSKFYLRGKLVFRVQLKPVCYFRGIEHFCPYEVNIIQSRVLFRVKARVEIRKSNEGTDGKRISDRKLTIKQ